jgi:hypothetical protein
MDKLLKEERFDYVSDSDKVFILAFNEEMTRLGYDFGGKIGSGYGWGKYMVIYTKAGVKSKAVYARIYIPDTGIVLRLFLNKVDKHEKFIEKAPAHIKAMFTASDTKCKHDRDDEDGKCRSNFRRTYTIDGQLIEQCMPTTYYIFHPEVQKIPDYIALFTEFYPPKKTVKNRQS